jgi:hypothetical protein
MYGGFGANTVFDTVDAAYFFDGPARQMGGVRENHANGPRGRLEHALDIGSGEIVADEEKRTGVCFCDHVGETIAEIERRRVHAAAPPSISFGNPLRDGCRHGHDVYVKLVKNVRYLLIYASPGRDDQQLGQSAGRNHYVIVGRKRRFTRLTGRFSQDYCHKGGGVDGDHFGKPSSS